MQVTSHIDYSGLDLALAGTSLASWWHRIRNDLPIRFSTRHHGDFARWHTALEALPTLPGSRTVLNQPCVEVIGAALDATTRNRLEQALRALHPWRKGPFQLHGLHIDSEWRSDWKWARLPPSARSLSGQRVLDVGCGSGYYGWRMLGAGADLVMGIDPTLLFVMQFFAVRHYIPDYPIWVLPFGIEQMPDNTEAFDTVFSMGVLYHRKQPLQHLQQLHQLLHPGGQLVLESLVLDRSDDALLQPKGRYARMPNVQAIPSTSRLQTWLAECGYVNICLADVTTTSTEEQRSTDWMRFESLTQCLDSQNPSRTIEGYPAPVRAIVTANKPLTTLR